MLDSTTDVGASQLSQSVVRRRRGVVLCGLGLMILAPLVALDDVRPARLGWQMYAASVDLPTIEVLLSDGSREQRRVEDIASGFRPEIDYFEPVARFICTREPNVSSVHLTRQSPEHQLVVECAEF